MGVGDHRKSQPSHEFIYVRDNFGDYYGIEPHPAPADCPDVLGGKKSEKGLFTKVLLDQQSLFNHRSVCTLGSGIAQRSNAQTLVGPTNDILSDIPANTQNQRVYIPIPTPETICTQRIKSSLVSGRQSRKRTERRGPFPLDWRTELFDPIRFWNQIAISYRYCVSDRTCTFQLVTLGAGAPIDPRSKAPR